MELDRAPLTAFAELIDGLVLPRPLGGDPALDLCNTVSGWGEPAPHDYLLSYDHLVGWTAGAGLIDAAAAGRLRRRARRAPGEAAQVLDATRDVRRALHAVALAPRSGRDWELVADVAHEAMSAARLELAADGPAWVLPARAGLRLPLLAIGRAAGELLTSERLETVRACPGTGCGWLFLAPGGRRRWCTMAVCGNRAKVRRFAERRRSRARVAGGTRSVSSRQHPRRRS